MPGDGVSRETILQDSCRVVGLQSQGGSPRDTRCEGADVAPGVGGHEIWELGSASPCGISCSHFSLVMVDVASAPGTHSAGKGTLDEGGLECQPTPPKEFCSDLF